MTRKLWITVAVLAALFALDLGASIDSFANWHKSPTGPSVMTLSQLAGFITSTVLFLILILVATAAVRASLRARALRRRYRQLGAP